MPLTSNEATLETAKELLGLFKGAFGTPGGYRPAHAKGILLDGTFKPTAEAASLSKAHHFNVDSIPVTVRFSNSTGIPQIPDNDSNAVPRGFAVRFHYPEENGRRKHTDIIGHSVPLFPSHTGQDFVELFKAIGASAGATEHPSPIETYLGSHPAAAAFVTAPKPFAESWATEGYYALNAFKFTAADGKETYIRYEFEPTAGLHYYTSEQAASKPADYLTKEIKERVAKKKPIGFKILAQIAEEGDPTDDITKRWPADRKKVELGTIELTSLVGDDEGQQKTAIFDPIPRVDGIVESADPILEVRAALYLISGRERRSA